MSSKSEKSFILTYLTPEECVAGYMEVFYTDGSKTEEGSGAGVYLSNKNEKWAFPLGQYATVFQAEDYAILRVANWVIDERSKGRCIAINRNQSVDSQAARIEQSFDHLENRSGMQKPFELYV